MELTLKDRKLINNGGIPEQEQRLEDKISSTAIPLEGTTGQSTLTDRKYIKNLPKFNDGVVTNPNGISTGHYNFAGRTSAASQLASGPTKIPNNLPTSGGGGANFGKTLGNVAGAAAPYAGALMQNATAAVDFVSSIGSAGKFNKSADDLLQEAGGAEGNIGGVSYQTQNEINAQDVAAQTSAENKANTVGLMGKGASLGASVGSVAGPVGGLIGGAVGAIGGLVGGLFGSSKRKREMRRRIAEAQDKALRQNDFSRNGALTSILQQNYAREYGDTETQSLYGFANGKSTWSAAGSVGLGANARVSNGEIIANKYTGEMFRVPGLPNNKDGKLAFIRPSDTIISNKYGLSDYVASTGDLEGGEAMQGMIMKSLGKKGYKNGKLPGFAWGLPEWLNMATNSIGMVSSLVDKSKIDNEPISRPNTRKTNPYADSALNILAQQSFNPYSGYKDVYDIQDKRTYATRNNAGMSAAQRAVVEYAGYNDAMQSLAKFNQYAQDKNSALASAYANAKLQAGENQATRDMQAEQFDYNAYNQAHGAKTLASSMKQGDVMNYLNNFTKGVIDMHNWRKMMSYYDQDENEATENIKQKNKGIKTKTGNFSTSSLGFLKGKYGDINNPYKFSAPSLFTQYNPLMQNAYKIQWPLFNLTKPKKS